MAAKEDCLADVEITQFAESNSADAVTSVVVPGKARLVDLQIELDDASTVDNYFFLFDASSAAEVMNASPAARKSMLKAVPVKLTAGSTVSLTPTTRWTPFRNGIVVMNYTDDDYTTDSGSESFGAAAFKVWYHIMSAA